MNLCAVSGVNSNSRFQIYFKWGNSVVSVIPPLSHVDAAKLLQKSEMRKDIVIELSYRGFSRASDYS